MAGRVSPSGPEPLSSQLTLPPWKEVETLLRDIAIRPGPSWGSLCFTPKCPQLMKLTFWKGCREAEVTPALPYSNTMACSALIRVTGRGAGIKGLDGPTVLHWTRKPFTHTLTRRWFRAWLTCRLLAQTVQLSLDCWDTAGGCLIANIWYFILESKYILFTDFKKTCSCGASWPDAPLFENVSRRFGGNVASCFKSQTFLKETIGCWVLTASVSHSQESKKQNKCWDQKKFTSKQEISLLKIKLKSTDDQRKLLGCVISFFPSMFPAGGCLMPHHCRSNHLLLPDPEILYLNLFSCSLTSVVVFPVTSLRRLQANQQLIGEV